jgi:signal transduction histidine kinase
MISAGRLRERAKCHPFTTDFVVAAAVLVIVVIVDFQAQPKLPGNTSAASFGLQAATCSALGFRSSRPKTALALTTLGSLLVMSVAGGSAPVAMAAVLAVASVAHHTNRRTAVAAALIVGPLLLIGAAWRSGSWADPSNFALLAWTGFAAAAGDAGRNKKAYVAAIEERARRAEHTREEEAQRRVIEERLRIARELHDVVAHHIAVIHVQAGVVGHLMTEQPEAAQQALGHVRHASRAVLDELGGLLDVLRQPDDPVTPTDPTPGLDRLGTLVDSFAASGLQVDWKLSGIPQALPSAVDLVAYRLVQEGLTNAHKHGTGSATLGVCFEQGSVAINIVNPSAVAEPAVPGAAASAGSAGSVPERPGTGHGLVGMRERARAVGGSVRAVAHSDGTWRVTALLPVQVAT